MLRLIATVIVVLLAGILAVAASKPDTFRVQRSIRIAAPPEKVFPLVSSLHKWDGWSPYEKRDPAMKKVHSGAPSGKGAVYQWEGNKEIGQGRMEIVEANSPYRVVIKLDFLKPFEAHNTAEFVFKTIDGQTDVTWAMYGPQSFMGRVMSLFFSMDRMVGGDFETGLANLKVIAEK